MNKPTENPFADPFDDEAIQKVMSSNQQQQQPHSSLDNYNLFGESSLDLSIPKDRLPSNNSPPYTTNPSREALLLRQEELEGKIERLQRNGENNTVIAMVIIYMIVLIQIGAYEQTFGLSIFCFFFHSILSPWMFRSVYNALRLNSSLQFFIFFIFFCFQNSNSIIHAIVAPGWGYAGWFLGFNLIKYYVKKTVKLVYYWHLFYFFAMFLNVIICILVLIQVVTHGQIFGLSFTCFFIYTLFSICLFRRAYNALRQNSSPQFFLFFIFFCIQILRSINHAIAASHWGFFGLIFGFKMISYYNPSGLLFFFVSLVFTLSAIFETVLYIKVHRIYRSSNANMDRVQEEIRSGNWRFAINYD